MYIHEKVSLDENVKLVVENENCAVYKVEDASGEGLMTCYHVFPGIVLLYNDFHIESFDSQVRPHADMFCVDHCREGRIEWELDNGNCMYQDSGILQFDTREKQKPYFNCPLRYYHGITINFFIDEAQESLSTALDGFAVDLRGLREKLCPGGWPRAMTAGRIPGFNFETLYTMNEHIRLNLFRIKILELLLYLDVLPTGDELRKRSYFRKTQVDTIKAIERFMTAHPENRYTLEELSERFKISLTSMKRCFKGVYDSSMYTYMRTWRMNAAAVMLRETNESIIFIAGELGYDNASKFSSAFQDVIGKTPSEYRKNLW
ncbi:MAG: AraC family transcriptional regulator [Treponema sp.]|nr:AraC family transcriptional regulator [Treponema sp.]